MQLSIPILAEQESRPTGQKSFAVRPLFRLEPLARADRLRRALDRLRHELHLQLDKLAEQPRHDELASWAFHPDLIESMVDVRLEVRGDSHHCRVLVVRYEAGGRILCLVPALPRVQFELWPHQSLAERATEVLTQHLRQDEKEGGYALFTLLNTGKLHLTTLELEVEPGAKFARSPKPKRAMLFGDFAAKDGKQELRKTGRALHQMFPDELDRAVGRDAEVTELERLLTGADRRPIVLVGPRQAGKTAVIHEFVWRSCARHPEGHAARARVWLLSPARLISGMSYLGEWENRVLAIGNHAATAGHVLYFDDLPGLLTAGTSAASDLNVAQVLKPLLEKRTVRVLAEITPESWRVLRERDRAFADLFHVLPVHETDEAHTLRVLVSVARHLETQHRCEFSLAVVPAVFDLLRRFGGDAAFPGKAAGFLRRLGLRHAGAKVDAEAVAREFQEQTGLHAAFMGGARQHARAEILRQLRVDLVGQEHAQTAFADLLVKLQARLNDPRRPLGTFLLLGPTGVGKTQAAKALAKLLFGDAQRLLRFDLNEYVDPAAAARLAGTPMQPEGLLTSAIRRQPFSVVLFDEIEKAAPEVFDLLLGVLDEGRLTDALGRVANFTHTIIVLTSNLVAPEARSRLGFGAGDPTEADQVFVSAAEKHFRPEFFNRLDAIIPFRPLTRDELEKIAMGLMSEVCWREGVRRRECLVQVAAEAQARLVTLGYHPQMGARALKRAIERELAQPLARRLAATPPGSTTLASLGADDHQFHLHLETIHRAPRTVAWLDRLAEPRSPAAQREWLERLFAQVDAFLQRVKADLDADAPAGPVRWGEISPAQERYALSREEWRRVKSLRLALPDRLREASGSTAAIMRFQPTPLKVTDRSWSRPRTDPGKRRRQSADHLRLETAEVDRRAQPEAPEGAIAELLRGVAWLEALRTQPPNGPPAVLLVHALLRMDGALAMSLAALYHGGVVSLQGSLEDAAGRPEAGASPGLVERWDGQPRAAFRCAGGAWRAAIPSEPGFVLVRRPDGSLGLLHLELREAASVEEAEALAKTSTSQPGSYLAVHELVEAADGQITLTDFRSGWELTCPKDDLAIRGGLNLLLSALPLPKEISL